MKKYTVYLSLVLMGLTIACQQKPQKDASKDETSCIITPELKKLIKLEKATIMSINKEFELTGSVSYDQDHIYSYQSLSSGVVEKVNFKIGDYVQKGQVLAEVRTAELTEQKSNLIKAEAELKLAIRKKEATQNLRNDGVASDRELIEAKNEVTAAQTEINRIKETLSLQGGNVSKGLLSIKAPFSGYVVEKKITNGTQIDAGQDDLFVISDLKKVWVMANVYAAQLGNIKVGQTVEIETTAYPDKIFPGKISRLSNVFDADERVLKAIIENDNNDLKLKPSMMVSVNVYQPTADQALGIPKDAVMFANNAYYLVLYKTDCDVRAVNIKPLANDKKYYYIAAEGIEENDTIISQNQLLIYNKLIER